jgi:hypothetical protein
MSITATFPISYHEPAASSATISLTCGSVTLGVTTNDEYTVFYADHDEDNALIAAPIYPACCPYSPHDSSTALHQLLYHLFLLIKYPEYRDWLNHATNHPHPRCQNCYHTAQLIHNQFKKWLTYNEYYDLTYQSHPVKLVSALDLNQCLPPPRRVS